MVGDGRADACFETPQPFSTVGFYSGPLSLVAVTSSIAATLEHWLKRCQLGGANESICT